MVSKITIFVVLLSLSTTVNSTPESDWVRDWWENTYEQRIRQEQQTNINKDLSKCDKKIIRYKNKLKQRPKSEYFKYKLEQWIKKCNDN